MKRLSFKLLIRHDTSMQPKLSYTKNVYLISLNITEALISFKLCLFPPISVPPCLNSSALAKLNIYIRGDSESFPVTQLW